jgi:hypothetical protein
MQVWPPGSRTPGAPSTEQVWPFAASGGALREGNSAQLAPVAAAPATAEPNKSAMASFTRDLASA